MYFRFKGLETSLKRLVLAHNGLRNIPVRTLNRHSTLESVDLSYNRFNDDLQKGRFPLDKDLFRGSRRTLKSLNLANVNLRRIPVRLLRNLSNLEALNLMGNQIEAIRTNELSANRRLKVLNLQNNRIAFLNPHAFVGLDRLEELSLGMNQLEYTRFNSLVLPTANLIRLGVL